MTITGDAIEKTVGPACEWEGPIGDISRQGRRATSSSYDKKEGGQTPITVLLFEEHRLLRMGIKHLLENDAHIKIVEGSQIGEAVEKAHAYRPDVILLTIHVHRSSTYADMDALLDASPRSGILAILPMHADSDLIHHIRNQIKGALGAESSVDDLGAAIRRINRGYYHIAPEVAHHFIGAKNRGGSSPFGLLSRREMEATLLIAEGNSSSEIAARMGISPRTLGTFRHRLFRKLGIKTDAELVHLVLKQHLRQREVHNGPVFT
ncbi:LuxR C-terminal-related transcriptional regulator [Solimonas aquatica]|uniref:LuxR C-terminal-related transcriptional regulator n=1 Tax=Solimonas aquatica TaxID=489703 RepID=UPI000B8528C6|nr:response regulator transcription factor [Solimonas aquatica]